MMTSDAPQQGAAPQPQASAPAPQIQAPSSTTDEKFLAFLSAKLGVEAPNFDFVTGVRRTVRFPSMEDKPEAKPQQTLQLPSTPPALPAIASSAGVPMPPGSDNGMP